jgi:hypothetical protein
VEAIGRRFKRRRHRPTQYDDVGTDFGVIVEIVHVFVGQKLKQARHRKRASSKAGSATQLADEPNGAEADFLRAEIAGFRDPRYR